MYNEFFQILLADAETTRQAYVTNALPPPGQHSLTRFVRLFACPLSAAEPVVRIILHRGQQQRLAWGTRESCTFCSTFRETWVLTWSCVWQFDRPLYRYLPFLPCTYVHIADTKTRGFPRLEWWEEMPWCSSTAVTAVSTCHWQGPGSCIGSNMALVRNR